MKIGRFAKVNNLTADTIRHYMDIGLLLPEKLGGHYDFDDRCQKDLEDILTLKNMSFSLMEIKSIFIFKRLAKLTEYQKAEYYKEFFIVKHEKLNKQIQELNKMKNRLEAKLKEPVDKIDKTIIGIDIKYLNLFKCANCKKDLVLSEATIQNNQVINGRLKCSCGDEYKIEEGILILSNNVKFNADFNIIDYINNTDADYLDNISRGLEWVHKKLDLDRFKNKTVLELGSGMGLFLRNIYENLPDDSVYIAIDHNITAHKFLKSILEISGSKKNIIFICSDFLKLPLDNKSVDIVLDTSGSSNYALHNQEFLLKKIDMYLKDECYLIGTYILFKNFAFNSSIEPPRRKNFILHNVKEELSNLKYTILEDTISNYLENGGKYEDYFKKGEKVYFYYLIGERWG